MKRNIISSGCLDRVFHIAVGEKVGTGFIVEYEDDLFLVTAKHLFENVLFAKDTLILIDRIDRWDEAKAQVFYHDNEKLDLAVIKTDYFDGMTFEKVKYSSTVMEISQDVFMLGYPHGLKTSITRLESRYPHPLVKKGVYSGIILAGNNSAFIMGWTGNCGFSGGPVICHAYDEENDKLEEYIVGVISGGYPHKVEVMNKDGEKTEHYIEEGTGIGFVDDIEDAIDIIKTIK